MTHGDTSLRPSAMSKTEFVDTFGGVFEHSPWIAERACENCASLPDQATQLQELMADQFRRAGYEERLAVLNAHPDLAGKLADAKQLTPESTSEQASAGLDALTDEDRATFQQLNSEYVGKFGFPFIIAVRGLTTEEILKAFKTRIAHDQNSEFDEACAQVEKIALLRLQSLLDQ